MSYLKKDCDNGRKKGNDNGDMLFEVRYGTVRRTVTTDICYMHYRKKDSGTLRRTMTTDICYIQ